MFDRAALTSIDFSTKISVSSRICCGPKAGFCVEEIEMLGAEQAVGAYQKFALQNNDGNASSLDAIKYQKI